MVNTQLKESISETLDILQHMDNVYIEKIPKEFTNFLYQNKSTDYIPNLDHTKKINEMNLKEQTKDLLAIIYMMYWCSEEERAEYIELLQKNEKKYQNEINEKYNPDKLFSSKNIESDKQENLPVEIKEKSIFKKIIAIIKKIFNFKN